MFQTIRNAWKIADLRKKILYTFMILLIFRIGSNIPVPFVAAKEILDFMSWGQAGSVAFGGLDIMSGGGLSQATLFALGISPYITSSIVIQLLAVAIPYLENLSKEGPDGQKKLNTITRYTTLGLAVLQSVAYYLLLKQQGAIIPEAGTFGSIVVVAAYTAGAMFTVWLGEQIDKNGIGNGISMILFAGIVARAPNTVINLVKHYMMKPNPPANTRGAYYAPKYYAIIPIILVLFVVMIFAIVIMTNAERRIPVQYAKRVVGRKQYGGQSSFMPIKVTMSGVMPVIFASSILSLPAMIKMFVDPEGQRTIGRVLGWFDPSSWLYVILYVLLIIAFNYFYVAIQYDPVEMANNLRKNSGAIPGIRPGEPTANFISRVISRITLVGALFIAAVCVIPIISGIVGGLPLHMGGTSIIIVVGVALDTVQELESQMMMRHYKGFLA